MGNRIRVLAYQYQKNLVPNSIVFSRFYICGKQFVGLDARGLLWLAVNATARVYPNPIWSRSNYYMYLCRRIVQREE